MNHENVQIKSSYLSKDMKISIYGHFGTILLLFPGTKDSVEENEEMGLIDSISQFIKSGRIKVYSVSSVNFESWLNYEIEPEKRSKRHYEYDRFLMEEVVRLIYEDSGGAVPIVTCGCAIGAFHAANSYFKRPDLFLGTIAMSGTYNIHHFSGDYFDENCYFNSPVHYLPNLTDNYWISFLQNRHHIYLLSGSGENEYPQNSIHLAEILKHKNIPYHLDIWGREFGHNFNTWNKMLPTVIGNIL